MELWIQKYCTVTPLKISVNGKLISEIDNMESFDKSLVQTYRNLGLNYPKFFKMDNLSKLTILATECLLKDNDRDTNGLNENMAVILSNASSSMVTDQNYHNTISNPENYFPSPSLFVYTLPNICIGEICIKYKIFGSNMFFISQIFDPSSLFFYVNELFKDEPNANCLTGWVECNQNGYEAFVMLVGEMPGQNKFDIKTIDFLYNNK